VRFEPGQVVGRYELVKKLGTGSFAEVWKAVEMGDVGFTKEVALKIVKQDDDNNEEGLDDSLLKEAQLCANLRHPNIVDVLGVEEIDGGVQVAMEFVEGGTLSGLVAKVRAAKLLIPQSVVLDIGIGICRALHRAHTFSGPDGNVRPIIHRDLKPANILMSKAGVPKIADFGLAKSTGETSATATGTLKGTPAYIAPELWEGGRDFEPRVDLFAVGCILWELVQLERLFAGQNLAQIYVQVVREDPAEEAAKCRVRYPALVPVIERLIQRDPEKRYQKASSIIKDLQRLRRGAHASGEIEDFMDLILLTELPEDERELPPSSQFQLPETTDPAWQALIAEALGQTIPVDPSFGEIDPAAVRGGAASGEGGQSSKTVSTLELAAEAAKSNLGSGARDGATAVLPRSATARMTQSVNALVEEPKKKKSKADTLVLVVLLLVTAAIAWFAVGPGAESEVGTAQQNDAAPQSAAPVSSEKEEPPSSTTEAGEEAGTADAPSPPEKEVVAAAPTPTAPVAQPKPAVTPAPAKAAKAVVTPEPAKKEPPVAAKEPEAPAERPPALAPGESCLLLTSSPGGLAVWINGSPLGKRAGRAAPTKVKRGPGNVKVGMGASGSASLEVNATLNGGAATAVHCDLMVSRSCKARAADAEKCR